LDGLNLDATDPITGATFTTSRPFKGWGGVGSSINIVPKTRAHGAAAGRAYFSARHLVVNGLLKAPSEAALDAAIDRLIDACGLDDTLLTIVEARGPRWCMVRREDEVLASKITPTMASWSIQVVALDPRKFGTELTASTGLASVSGGLVIPFTIPYTIDSTVESGQVSLINPGNEVGPVLVRIDGPVIGPGCTHVVSGLAVTVATTLELGVGEWIDIDMEKHRVYAQGQAGRANWITSRGWSGFEPGANTWGFSAATYSAGARMTITATPAAQ